MHCEENEFALPKLPKKKKWKKLMETGNKENTVSDNTGNMNDTAYIIEKRSIAVFVGE